nr:MAG TPA: hypothetical protein [Caudoviricetes sp.]
MKRTKKHKNRVSELNSHFISITHRNTSPALFWPWLNV